LGNGFLFVFAACTGRNSDHRRPAGVYGAFSAGLITAGVLAPWVGKQVDRLGGRLVIGIGTLLLSAGFALVAWSPSLVIFCLAWQILGLAMPMTLHEPAFATLVQIAGAKRARLATTQLTLAAGFASTVFWPLTHVCDHQMGWRETYLFFAAANLIVSLPLHILILPPPSSSSKLVSNPSEGETERYSINPDFRHDRLAFLLVAFIFADNGFVFSGPSVRLLPVLQSFGLSVASGSALVLLSAQPRWACGLIKCYLDLPPPSLVSWRPAPWRSDFSYWASSEFERPRFQYLP
jgi:MFS family permease